MQLPFVLQSAEAMKAAVKFLEPFMDKVEGESNKGVMVLATVKGDVHDIGKNLVDIILTNNGYKVVNLGIKQPVDEILMRRRTQSRRDRNERSAREIDARDARQSRNYERTRSQQRPSFSAARLSIEDMLTMIWCRFLNGRLFYARDAFDGLHAMDLLTQKRFSRRRHGDEEKAKTARGKRQSRNICSSGNERKLRMTTTQSKPSQTTKI